MAKYVAHDGEVFSEALLDELVIQLLAVIEAIRQEKAPLQTGLGDEFLNNSLERNYI